MPVGGPIWCMTENMANATYRGYNYPHQAGTWFGMYRVARYFDLLTTELSWSAYLWGAYNTALQIGQADVGFMDGTVFREILDALQAEGSENATIAEWASTLDANMRARATAWSTETFPYGSEFNYDTTGQEEVYVWLSRYNYTEQANATLNAVLAYMRLIPNWAWHGGARSMGDLGNNGKWFINRGTERLLMHYRAGLNNIPILEGFRANPDDRFLLETGMGALTGQLVNIDESGATSMGFHSVPFVLDFDPRSGDYGCGFFGITTEASSTITRHSIYGWQCFLCNVWPASSETTVGYTVADAYHVKTYIEPLGLYATALAGNLQSIFLDLTQQTASLTFAPALSSPASRNPHAARPFSWLYLKLEKSASTPGIRPGRAFMVMDSQGRTCPQVRGAFQITPATDDSAVTTVTVTWQQ